MVFDFGSEEFVGIPNFKGGEGHFDAKMHDDGRCKVIRGRIEPGSTSGYHLHEANCEVIYVISGRAWFDYDGEREYAEAGQAHYCPMGHSHAMGNASPSIAWPSARSEGRGSLSAKKDKAPGSPASYASQRTCLGNGGLALFSLRGRARPSRRALGHRRVRGKRRLWLGRRECGAGRRV